MLVHAVFNLCTCCVYIPTHIFNNKPTQPSQQQPTSNTTPDQQHTHPTNQTQIGGVSVVDVSAAEAGGVHGGNALHVAVSPSGRVCGVTQTGSGGGVDPSVLLVGVCVCVCLVMSCADVTDDHPTPCVPPPTPPPKLTIPTQEMIQQARTCALGLIAALDTQVEKEAAEEATEEEEDMQQ